MKASKQFSAEDRKRIEAAVRDAELKTSAEIVPVVVTASGRYDRAEDLAGLWCGILLLALTWWLFPRIDGEAMWGPWWVALELPALIVAVIAGFAIGAIVTSHLFGLRYLFTPRSEMREEVAARAQQAFYQRHIQRTAGGTGLIIYLSLYERTAAIVGDDAVLEKLTQGSLEALCEKLSQGMRSGHPADALIATIADAGDRLGRVLPRHAGDINELPNSVYILD
ncbi:MAG: hypothetical protein IT567_05080 [Alphaproteobacteria bacterium]|nr:hypothetical protein [Alphaproteobacteria bacterium]